MSDPESASALLSQFEKDKHAMAQLFHEMEAVCKTLGGTYRDAFEAGHAYPDDLKTCLKQVLGIHAKMMTVVSIVSPYSAWNGSSVSEWILVEYCGHKKIGWPALVLARVLQHCVLTYNHKTKEERKKDQSFAWTLVVQLKEKKGQVHMAVESIFNASSDDQVSTWTCQACTFDENPMNVFVCEVCGCSAA